MTTDSFTAQDQAYMARALQLAAKGLYSTHPNPRVGCVLTKDGQIISQGWHQRAGLAHAEVRAIGQTKENLSGATAYVTLEPCAHQGRTGPCTQALIDAGIRRVVIAEYDPNSQVKGGGAEILKRAGVEVQVGLLAPQARELNKGFYSLHEQKRPWVRIKTATSIDGRTAMASGESQWITSANARVDGHRFRAQSSAILTGIGTLLADDPSLNVRLDEVERQPARVVLDSQLRTPTNAKIFATESEVYIFTLKGAKAEKLAELQACGAVVIQVDADDAHLDLTQVLTHLAALNLSEIHVEAGLAISGAFIRQNLFDELVLYMAPTLLSDAAKGMFAVEGLTSLQQQRRLKWHDVRRVGDDLRLILRP